MSLANRSYLGAILDQGATSVASLVVVVAVARVGEPEDFGRIAAMQLGVALAVQGYRQAVGSSLLREGPTRYSAIANRAASAIALVGVVLVSIATVGGVLPVALGSSFACVILGAMVQERGRLQLQASRKNLRSGAFALLTLALVLLSSAVSVKLDLPSWVPWAAAGLVQAAVWTPGLPLERTPPLSRAQRRSVLIEWRQATGAFVLQALTWSGPVIALGAFSGAAAVAGLRGGQSLAALGQQVPQAMFPFFMARGMDRRSRHAWTILQTVLFGGLCAATLLAGHDWGPLVMGQSWGVVSMAIMPVLMAAYLASLTLRYEIDLRLVHRTDLILKVRRAWLAPQILVVVLAAAWGGLVGTAWVIAASQVAILVTFVAVWRRTTATPRACHRR